MPVVATLTPSGPSPGGGFLRGTAFSSIIFPIRLTLKLSCSPRNSFIKTANSSAFLGDTIFPAEFILVTRSPIVNPAVAAGVSGDIAEIRTPLLGMPTKKSHEMMNQPAMKFIMMPAIMMLVFRHAVCVLKLFFFSSSVRPAFSTRFSPRIFTKPPKGRALTL